jgi:hypothetical protein
MPNLGLTEGQARFGLRQRFPQAEDAELRRCLADLLLGPDLARKVCSELIDEPIPRLDRGHSLRE